MTRAEVCQMLYNAGAGKTTFEPKNLKSGGSNFIGLFIRDNKVYEFGTRTNYITPPELWKIFPGTHPTIIDRETWERVQELRRHKRRPTRTGRPELFSGVAFCADCGAKLYFQACSSFDKRNQAHYICNHYQSQTSACTAHYIREQALSQVVLEHLRATVEYVQEYEAEFVRAIMDKSRAEQKRSWPRSGGNWPRQNAAIPSWTRFFSAIMRIWRPAG